MGLKMAGLMVSKMALGWAEMRAQMKVVTTAGYSALDLVLVA